MKPERFETVIGCRQPACLIIRPSSWIWLSGCWFGFFGFGTSLATSTIASCAQNTGTPSAHAFGSASGLYSAIFAPSLQIFENGLPDPVLELLVCLVRVAPEPVLLCDLVELLAGCRFRCVLHVHGVQCPGRFQDPALEAPVFLAGLPPYAVDRADIVQGEPLHGLPERPGDFPAAFPFMDPLCGLMEQDEHAGEPQKGGESQRRDPDGPQNSGGPVYADCAAPLGDQDRDPCRGCDQKGESVELIISSFHVSPSFSAPGSPPGAACCSGGRGRRGPPPVRSVYRATGRPALF